MASRKRKGNGGQVKGLTTEAALRRVDAAAQAERYRGELARVAPWVRERGEALDNVVREVDQVEAMLREHAAEAADLSAAMTRTAVALEAKLAALRSRARDVAALLTLPVPEAPEADELPSAHVERAVRGLQARVAKLSDELVVARRAPYWARYIVRTGKTRVGPREVSITPALLAQPSMADAPTQMAIFQAGLRVLREAHAAEVVGPGDALLPDLAHEAPPALATEPVTPATLEGCAEFFGVSERTVRRWMKEGHDCGVTVDPAEPRGFRADLTQMEAWRDKRQVKAS